MVPFPAEAIVEIASTHGVTAIGPARKFWWGDEQEVGEIGEGVITRARRLDKPKELA